MWRILSSLALLYLCTGQEEDKCYPPCGCFTDGPPFVARPLPDSPQEQELVWELYTRGNPAVAEDVTIDTTEQPFFFNPANPSKYLVHGWNSSPRGMDRMKDAILENFDYNVFIFDWEEGASGINYPTPASNARVAGACSAEVAKRWQSLDLAHCIGHSLGGQTCGYMGEYDNGTMARITGIDPAGPWFDSNDTRVRIDATDAVFVDTINTDTTGFFPLGLGEPIGDADFFPNNGERQPPCALPSCDHGIGVSYFISSITDNCYKSFPCNSRSDSDQCECETCIEGETCQYMGFYADQPPISGTFFLRTVDPPVGQSHYCETEPFCVPQL